MRESRGMHYTLLVAALFIAAASIVASAFADADEQQEQGLTIHAPLVRSGPTNVFKACALDILTICSPDERLHGVNQCLVGKKGNLREPVCREWIDARIACRNDARRSSSCKKRERSTGGFTLRACLKRMTKVEFSEDCYGSAFLGGMLRGAERHPRSKNEE